MIHAHPRNPGNSKAYKKSGYLHIIRSYNRTSFHNKWGYNLYPILHLKRPAYWNFGPKTPFPRQI